jgi:hypothetical protein
MARKFRATRCVHCLSYLDRPSSDHVFPKSWYPLSTPLNLEKWQAPSCGDCNQKHGENENDLLIRLGLCVGDRELASLGISQKALSALDPSRARDETDRQARLSKRKQFLDEIRSASQVSSHRFAPGFGPTPDSPSLGRNVLPVSAESLKMLGRKLVSGATYALYDRSYIEVDHVVAVHIVNARVARATAALIDQYGTRVHRGPGIVIGQARPAEDGQSAIFEILIWGRLVLHASIIDVLSDRDDRPTLGS